MATQDSQLTWTHDGRNEDGSAYTQDQHVGFGLYLDGEQVATLPAALNPAGEYSVRVGDLGLEVGTYSVELTTIARRLIDGVQAHIQSLRSDAITLVIDDTRRPSRPFQLAVT